MMKNIHRTISINIDPFVNDFGLLTDPHLTQYFFKIPPLKIESYTIRVWRVVMIKRLFAHQFSGA